MTGYVVVVWNQASGRPQLPPHSVVYDRLGDAVAERDVLRGEYAQNRRLEVVEVCEISRRVGAAEAAGA